MSRKLKAVEAVRSSSVHFVNACASAISMSSPEAEEPKAVTKVKAVEAVRSSRLNLCNAS